MKKVFTLLALLALLLGIASTALAADRETALGDRAPSELLETTGAAS